MFLKDAITAMNVKGTAAGDMFVKIVTCADGRILYKGKVKDVPRKMQESGWGVVEITRLDTWDGESMEHLPIWNRPYKVTVM